MKTNFLVPVFFLLAGSLPGSCSLANSVSSSNINSSNPAVAAQAQKIQDLERQVRDQKTIPDTGKSKLNGLEQQLKGARQNLKEAKTQVKAG